MDRTLALLNIIARLEKAQENLEIRVEERSRELSQANAALRHEIAQRVEAEKALLEISHREQHRLGQDLHDGLCQILVSVKFISEELREKLAAGGRPEAADAAMIESRLGEALTQADVVSRGLYPVELETNGLTEALRELAVKTSRTQPVDCRFKFSAPVPVDDPAVATHVFRIAQEAVANALKKGKARKIVIRLVRAGERYLLSVTDNGVGLRNRPMRQGMGLKIMEYRARMIHGFLRFQSRVSGCTRVSCSFPVRTSSGAPA